MQRSLTLSSEALRPFFAVTRRKGRPWAVQRPRGTNHPRPQEHPLVKPAGLLRIAVIGESGALELGETLRDEVASRRLQGRAEVINLAMGGAALSDVEKRFREALALSPDLILLYFGHNLHIRRPPIPAWIPPAAWKSHALALAGSLAFSPGPRTGASSYRETSAEYAELVDRFREESRRGGAVLVPCTVSSNLLVAPSAAAEDLADASYLAARFLHDSGRREAALQALRGLAASRASAWWSYELGLRLREAGRHAEAYRNLAAARDLDAERGRAPAALNELLRARAAGAGAPLFDFEALARRQAPGGVPGWESYRDKHHARAGLRRRIARRLLSELPALAGSAPLGAPDGAEAEEDELPEPFRFPRGSRAPGWEKKQVLDCSAWAEARLKDDAARRAAVESYSDPYLTALMAAGVADERSRAGDAASALRFAEEAVRRAPERAELRIQAGVVSLRAGRRARARDFFRQALTLEPMNQQALFLKKALDGAGGS